MFVGPLPHWKRRRPQSSSSFFGFQYKKRKKKVKKPMWGIINPQKMEKIE
jgi:hypothetical protein